MKTDPETSVRDLLEGWSPLDQVSLLLEYIDNQGDPEGFRDFLERAVREEGDGDGEPDADGEVRCKFCGKPCEDAYRHDGGWVGECCWDDRLRATE